MKRRFFSILIIVALICAVSVHAVDVFSVTAAPELAFSGSKSTCSVTIRANNYSDKISATMSLSSGGTTISSWTDQGSFVLRMSKTASVQRYQTYKLTVNYSINGVKQTPVSITRTNT